MARRHLRRVFGDITDTSSLHGFGDKGAFHAVARVSIVDARREFVELAMAEGVNRRELRRRFGIHPSTGYKWLGRWTSDAEFADRSRRPHSAPRQTALLIKERILALRAAHPAGGSQACVLPGA